MPIDFSGVNLEGIDTPEENAGKQPEADLSGVDFTGVDLSGVDFSGIDLSGAVAPDAKPERKEINYNDDDSAMTRGFKAGIDQTQAIAGGAIGLLGDKLGLESVRDYGLEVYNRNMDEAGENAPETNFLDIDSVGSAANWAGYALGNAAPMLAASLLGGGIGGIAAKALTKKGIERFVKEQVENGVEREVAEATAKKMAQTAVGQGSAAGAVASSFGMSAGSIYGDTEDADVAVAHGIVAGALDAFPVIRALRKAGVGEQAVEEISESVVSEIAKQGIAEGGTEAVQTFIEQHASFWVQQNESLLANLDEVNVDEIIESAAMGGLAGGVMGGGGAAYRKLNEKATAVSDNEIGRSASDLEAMLSEDAPDSGEIESSGDGAIKLLGSDDVIYGSEPADAKQARAEREEANRRAFEGQFSPKEQPVLEGEILGPSAELDEAQQPGIKLLGNDDVIYAEEAPDIKAKRLEREQVSREAFEGQFPAPDYERMNANIEQREVAAQQRRDAPLVRDLTADIPTPVLEQVRAQGADERLAAPLYRDMLPKLAGDLIDNGGMGYITDEDGMIKGRAPSQNPDWFRNNGDIPSKGYVEKVVGKALNGDKLGSKEQRVLSAMLDAVDDERSRGNTADDLYEWESVMDLASLERAIDPNDPEVTLDSWAPDADSLFADLPEYDGGELGQLGTLWEQALALGSTADELKAIAESSANSEDMARSIYAEIRRNIEATKTADRADRAGGSDNRTEASSDAPEIQGRADGEAGARGGAETYPQQDTPREQVESLYNQGLETGLQFPKAESNQEPVAPEGESFGLSLYDEADLAERAEKESTADEAEAKAQIDRERELFSLDGGAESMAATAEKTQKPMAGDLFAGGSNIQSTQPKDFKPLTAKQAIDRALIRNEGEIDEFNALAAKRAEAGKDPFGSNIVALRNAEKAEAASTANDGDANARELAESANAFPAQAKVGEAYMRAQSRGPVTAEQASTIRDFYAGDEGMEKLKSLADSTADMSPGDRMQAVIDLAIAPEKAKAAAIDEAAAEAALSPTNDLPEPTEAQKEAGNYKKAKVRVLGREVTIENPKGSKRSGVDPDGNAWSVDMKTHYGYLNRTEGADGDHVDVFLGDNPDSEQVFVVDQVNADGSFDEHKVMVGFDSQEQAVEAYRGNYQDGWKVGPVTAMKADEFKAWLDTGDTTKPLSGEIKAGSESAPAPVLAKSGNPFKNKRAAKSAATKAGLPDAEVVPVEGGFGYLPESKPNQESKPSNNAASEPVSSAATVANQGSGAQPEAKNIEDFGEVLTGARKHTAIAFGKTLSDSEIDVSAEPLSKSFPAPNIKKMSDEGVSAKALAYVLLLRNTIGSKPRKSFRVQRWADDVERKRQLASEIIEKGDDFKPDYRLKGLDFRADIPATAEALKDFPAELLGDAVKYRISGGSYSMFNGVSYSPSKTFWVIYDDKKRQVQFSQLGLPGEGTYFAESEDEAIADYAARIRGLVEKKGSEPKRKKYTDVNVYMSRATGERYLAFKVRSSVIRLKGGFDSATEARAYLDEFREEIQAKIDEMRKGPTMRGDKNKPRQGDSLRDGDITPEIFSDAFGFRGVQFGNYVEGKRRQSDLNRAYDALMDLADAVGVPPAALSLNGELGLAFGARGRGGPRAAAAHYEPSSVVINLTKNSGAGSLAHEWLHALDHYFGKQDGAMGFMSENRKESGAARKEVREAWKGVRKSITGGSFSERSAEFDKARSKPYWNTIIEKAARAFERYMIDRLAEKGVANDYLANVDMTGGAYPTAEEMTEQGIRAAFDNLFIAIESKQTDAGVMLYSKESAISGAGKPDGVSISDAQVEVDKFLSQYKGADDVTVRIFNNYKEAFGEEAPYRTKGGYSPKTDTLYLFAGEMDSVADLSETLRHEIFVHKGLGMVEPAQLKQLLDSFYAAAKDSSELAEIVDEVERVESGRSDRVKAEEILARIGQQKPSFPDKVWNQIVLAVQRLLNSVGLWSVSARRQGKELIYQIADAFSEGKRARRRVNVGDDTYSRSSTEADKVLAQWSRKLKQMASAPSGRFVLRVKAPLVLRELGVLKNIEVTRDRIEAIARKHRDIPADVFEGLPILLADPVAVYRRGGSKSAESNAVIEVKTDAGEPILVGIKGGEIKTITPKHHSDDKTGRDRLADDVYNGQLLYVRNEEALTEIRASKVAPGREQSPERRQDLPRNVLSKADIVNKYNLGDGDEFLFSRADTEIGGQFTPPVEESLSQTMIRVWQDKYQPLLTLQRAIEKRNGRLPDEQNAYMAEELFHGKVEEDLKAVEKTNVKPLTDYLAENKIDLKELDLYLMAKHASERNAYIASKREDMPDGGSGMTNAEADAILAGFDAEGKTPRLSEAADKVYAITRAQRRVFEVSGLMNPDEVAGWQNQYDFYVPLKGFAEGEKEAATPRRGRGFDIRGKESMKALGRRSMAESPTLHAIQDLTTAVIRYRKNEVGQRLLAMVEANPNQDYWQVFTNENPDMKMAEVDGVIQPVPVRNMGQLKDDYFAVKRDGVEYFIKLKDKRLHNAMQNLGPTPMNKAVRYLGAATRYLSMVNTSLNPEFVISNMARDIQTAVFNVLAEQDVEDGKVRGEALAADMVKGMPSAMKGIMRASFGKPARNDAEREIERYYRDFLADGAKTGYFDSKDIGGLEREVQQLIEISQGTAYGKFLSGKRKITDFVDKTNGAVENAIRLSAYIQARKAGEANPELGMTRERAASLAKNLTVNFNRKGEIGLALNTLYMFANASIQGTANFMRAIGTLDDSPLGKTLSNAYTGKKLNRAQKAAGVMMGASFALAALNRAFSEEDDDGVPFFDKVPGYVRERNLVLMKSVLGIGEPGEYWTIPLPYGYNVFYNMGDALESALNSDYQVRRDELLTGLAASFATSFNPIGWHQGGFIPSIAPTVSVPFVELGQNVNFFGGPIYRDNFAFGPQKSDSALSFRSTKEIYKDISEWMNEATGGGTYYQGKFGIDVSPDTLEHLAEFALGGLYTFATRSYDSVERLLQDRDVPVRNVPFRRKLEGEVTPYADQSEFYDRVKRVESLREQRKELRGRERIEFGKKYQDEIRLHEAGKAARKRLSQLRRQRDRVESNESLSPKEMDERVERIERRMKRVVDRYNKRYNEAIAGD